MRAAFDTIKQAVESFVVTRHNPSPKPFALAYSGGADSTALLHACHELSSKLGLTFHVVHVNHGLQKPADDWQAQCGQIAQQLGLPFQALPVSVNLQSGDGLEAAARNARYEAIADWMQSIGLTELWTAHHADDQLETVLLQLFRGSGFRGLTGMEPVSAWPVCTYKYPSLKIVRPLLEVKRSQIDQAVEECAFVHVTDPSNQDESLRRNWVRHTLLPQLQTQFPQMEASLHRLSDFFKTHFNEVDERVAAAMPTVSTSHGQLDLIAFRALDADLRLEVLRAWLQAQGVRCGSDKLIELNRQLDLEKGGMRQVAKGWSLQVQQHKARLIM
ncbi:MAG: tRNA lysidine(34) synthetase TilS [Limnobacter sp.]|nr:tRNA lysidine(34) synthetase TilS [Limnobacter sp.]